MDIAILVAKIIVVVFFFLALFVTISIIVDVVCWMVAKVTEGCAWVIGKIIALTITIISRFFIMLRDLFLLVWSALTNPIVHFFKSGWDKLTGTLKLWSLYWKYGRSEFKSFRTFCHHMRGEDNTEKDQPKENPKPDNPYQDALALFGFSDTESLTKADLKKRYRTLISHVHPDKGCPTSVLAGQVNRALSIIKQKRKWK